VHPLLVQTTWIVVTDRHHSIMPSPVLLNFRGVAGRMGRTGTGVRMRSHVDELNSREGGPNSIGGSGPLMLLSSD
jgi:hypothetical protein